jgi:carbon storage regulator
MGLMLVLSRKSQQAIVIGEGIVVTVLEIRGRHVKLGIDAPSEVPIRRQEVNPTRGARQVVAWETPIELQTA